MPRKSINLFGREIVNWGIHIPEKSKIVMGDKIGYGPSAESRYRVSALTPELLRKIALKEPMILKGILKKNKDTVRNWILIKPLKDTGKVPQTDLDIFHEFDVRTNFPHKLEVAGVCSNIYGNGYIERTFIEKNTTSESPVERNAEPLGLNMLNAENINEFDLKDKKGTQKYYIYKDGIKKKYIHPDRIIDVATDWLPFSHFGISKIQVASNILKSKMDADVTTGEILNWFGHGIPALTIQNMTEEQKKAAITYFKQHPDYFVFDQDYTLEIANPQRIDPKNFYEYFYVNIACTMEMPTHMLTGVQPGEVTGSEIGISDYYHDIENIQKTVFTPIIEDVYSQLLRSKGRKWNYKISWNPIFVDELSEAKIIEKRTLVAVQGKVNGIIDVSEARRIMNDGLTYLDPDKEIKKDDTDKPAPFLPNVEPNKPKEKPKMEWSPLTPVQKEMIERERELGAKEIIEQEKRVKKAKKK